MARLNKVPIEIEAVECIDALFEIERDINGKPKPDVSARAEHSRPLVTELKPRERCWVTPAWCP